MSVFSELDEAQYERWLDVSDSDDAGESDDASDSDLDSCAAARGDVAIARTDALGRHVVATAPLAAGALVLAPRVVTHALSSRSHCDRCWSWLPPRRRATALCLSLIHI